MNKQPRMIDADKAIKSLNEAIKNSVINSEEGTNPWFRGELNGLGFAKAIILSGQCDPDPITLPTINQTLETIIDELQYALNTGDDMNREFYIKNAIRFAQEAIDPIPLPTIKGDRVKHSDLGQVRIMSEPMVAVLMNGDHYEVYLSDLEVNP